MTTQPFSPPRTRQVTLTRPIFVKGEGLPKDGVCLFNAGETVTAQTDNGSQWYVLGTYRKKQIRVATILSTLER